MADEPAKPIDPIQASMDKTMERLKMSGKDRKRKRTTRTPEEVKQVRLAALLKSNEQRLIVKKLKEEKIKHGIPLTPSEAVLVAKFRTPGRQAKNPRLAKQQALLERTAELIIRPANVQELRLKVEEAAKRHGYDPFEELIKMTSDPDVKAEDKISIHKTLLPFLIPPLPKLEAKDVEVESKKVRVVIQQITMAAPAAGAPAPDYSAQAPAVAEVEVMAPVSDSEPFKP